MMKPSRAPATVIVFIVDDAELRTANQVVVELVG